MKVDLQRSVSTHRSELGNTPSGLTENFRSLRHFGSLELAEAALMPEGIMKSPMSIVHRDYHLNPSYFIILNNFFTLMVVEVSFVS